MIRLVGDWWLRSPVTVKPGRLRWPYLTRRRFEREWAGSESARRKCYEHGAFPAVRCRCGDALCRGWRRRYEDDWPGGRYPKDR